MRKLSTTSRQGAALRISLSEFNADNNDFPSPELSPADVVTLCMEALKDRKSTESLEVCFNFSSDRCRAAVGGTLEEFTQYAANPVFGKLINCDSYEILKTGNVIPGTQFRGEMQTFLIEIQKGTTAQDAMKAWKQTAAATPGKRLTLEERLRQRAMANKEEQPVVDDEGIKFLWTLQKERRPPRQNCWLVHEVLFTKNAGMLTT